MYLIDTNIISEVRKGRRCDPRVAAWYRAVRDDELHAAPGLVHPHRDGAAVGHGLHRIFGNVQKDLAQIHRVKLHLGQAGVQVQ